VFNSPGNITDPSGELPVVVILLVVGGGLVCTGGYTAWESWQSTGSPFASEIWAAAGEGIGCVGPRVVVNGLTDTVVSTITIGFVDRIELWPVPEEYRDAYEWGYCGSRWAWEVDLALATHLVGPKPVQNVCKRVIDYKCYVELGRATPAEGEARIRQGARLLRDGGDHLLPDGGDHSGR
jgi:hypothetical protein